MQWFQGNIPDAIKLSKQRGSLFIVYVYGQDELSGQMNSTWDDEAVSNCIQDSGAVAIRIENTSDECKFFSQIYPVVVVPSTFCIGDGGVPLEVIGGNVNPEEFVIKLKEVEQMHAAQKQSVASSTPNTGQTTSGTEQTASTSSSTGASGDQASAVPLDEKVQKAKELLEKTREEKAQKEFEKNREEEVKRRKLGQGLVQLKKSQQESQMSELKVQMKKDKEEERKAKEKIRQQIAMDREERQAKFEKEKQDREKVTDEKKREKLLGQQKQAAAEEARRSETARIQIRLPDGSSVSQSFPSLETLQSLHSFISQRTGQTMMLSTTFPKRRFTEEDMSRTFVDLELAPSAVVIALPGGRSVTQASSSSSAVQSGGIVALLFSPFVFLWNLLYSLLFGGRNSGGGSAAPQESQPSQPENTSQATRRTDRPTTAYQRRGAGRVRRLHDMDDDDEDMPTYNGNSTQQL